MPPTRVRLPPGTRVAETEGVIDLTNVEVYLPEGYALAVWNGERWRNVSSSDHVIPPQNTRLHVTPIRFYEDPEVLHQRLQYSERLRRELLPRDRSGNVLIPVEGREVLSRLWQQEHVSPDEVLDYLVREISDDRTSVAYPNADLQIIETPSSAAGTYAEVLEEMDRQIEAVLVHTPEPKIKEEISARPTLWEHLSHED